MLLGYTITKAPSSPRNSTWFTRLFLLVRGWGLGTRLPICTVCESDNDGAVVEPTQPTEPRCGRYAFDGKLGHHSVAVLSALFWKN